MMKKLWNDEAGALISMEAMIVATILVIGVVTGLSSVRDAVITELADVGAAIGNFDQTYTVHGSVSHSAATANFGYEDLPDFCDNGRTTTAARCLVICGGQFARPVGGSDNSRQGGGGGDR